MIITFDSKMIIVLRIMLEIRLILIIRTVLLLITYIKNNDLIKS